ncbi:hypothetical protein [Sphingomonas sp. ZB1N12]|uniref:hypothetical protein n=1 Tax=Sphingomonas arabinosi TaxID=3096160 RepID=UPI002FC7A3BE
MIVLMLTGAALLYVLQAGSGLTPSPNDKISSADFISIILTALGVILAALALFLGGLAIIGWSAFESRVKQSSDEFLERRFSTTDIRYVELVQEIKEDVRREIQVARGRKPQIENDSTFDEDAV